MAMIDYGAVVIKNGKLVNRDQHFMNMLEAVGWIDQKRIRYEDCDTLTSTDPLRAESDCENCQRAKYRVHGDPDVDGYKEVIADCRDVSFVDGTRHIDNNYFAYVGDQHFTAAFYKYSAVILVDKKEVRRVWCMDDTPPRSVKSRRMEYGGVNIHLKEIDTMVYHMSFFYNGDHYNIIYGYGIDTTPAIWHRIKVRYLGKATAHKVDKIYRRLLGKDL